MLCELKSSAVAEEWQVTGRSLSLMDEPPCHPFKGSAGQDGRNGWHLINFKHQQRIDGEVNLGIWKFCPQIKPTYSSGLDCTLSE